MCILDVVYGCSPATEITFDSVLGFAQRDRREHDRKVPVFESNGLPAKQGNRTPSSHPRGLHVGARKAAHTPCDTRDVRLESECLLKLHYFGLGRAVGKLHPPHHHVIAITPAARVATQRDRHLARAVCEDERGPCGSGPSHSAQPEGTDCGHAKVVVYSCLE